MLLRHDSLKTCRYNVAGGINIYSQSVIGIVDNLISTFRIADINNLVADSNNNC